MPTAWHNPYPASETTGNIFYSAFTGRLRQPDPARAYRANEYEFIAQIYEEDHRLLRFVTGVGRSARR